MSTWTQFKESANSKKVYLVKMRPFVEATGFALDSGSVYKATVNKKIIACRFDLVWLSVAASRAAMTAGTFFYDAATATLYVWLAGGANPSTGKVWAYFYLYFSTWHGYFDPDQNAWEEKVKSVPDFTRGRDRVFDPITTSFGKLAFYNAGFWDSIWTDYEWWNCLVEVRLTGYVISPTSGAHDWLDWSETQLLMTGIARPASFKDGEVAFEYSDLLNLLDAPFPLSRYTTSAYPNLDPSADGQDIHRGYGVLKGIRAVEIDTTTKRFKIDDQAIASIQRVYDDTGTIATTNYLSLGEFTVTAYQGTVYCDYTKTVGSNYGADIKKEILKNVLGLADANLNLTAFAALNTDRPYALGISIADRRPIHEVFDEINRSIVAEDATDRSGLVTTAALKKPSAADPGIEEYTDYQHVMPDPEFSTDYENVAAALSIGYGRDQSVAGERDQCLRILVDAAGSKYDGAPILAIDTALINAADVAAVGAYYKPFHDAPLISVRFDSPTKPLAQYIGKTIKYHRPDWGKGPAGLGQYWRINSIRENNDRNRSTITAYQ